VHARGEGTATLELRRHGAPIVAVVARQHVHGGAVVGEGARPLQEGGGEAAVLSGYAPREDELPTAGKRGAARHPASSGEISPAAIASAYVRMSGPGS